MIIVIGGGDNRLKEEGLGSLDGESDHLFWKSWWVSEWVGGPFFLHTYHGILHPAVCFPGLYYCWLADSVPSSLTFSSLSALLEGVLWWSGNCPVTVAPGVMPVTQQVVQAIC